MRIGLIGVGEVGRCLAPVLAPLCDGALMLCDRAPSAAAYDVARRLGSTVLPDCDAWIGTCDVIAGCADGGATTAIADTVADRGRSGQILLDFATAAPATKKAAAQRLDACGQHYVDIAIMGAITISGADTPLLAAGAADQAAVRRVGDRLVTAGLRLTWLDDAVAGDAASLKLLRSAFTKGLEALAVECLIAADHFGVRETLYDVLGDIDATPLPRFLDMLVTTHLVHAERRLAEIEQAEAQLRQADLPVRLLPAVRTLFQATASAMRDAPLTDPPAPKDALRRLRAIGTG